MNALGIIGTTIAGAVVGGGAGVVIGLNEAGDDLGFGAALFGLYGALWGGFAGVVVGAVVFA